MIGLLLNVDQNGKNKKDKKEIHFRNIPEIAGRQKTSDIVPKKSWCDSTTLWYGDGERCCRFVFYTRLD